jgi:hypothetical protein
MKHENLDKGAVRVLIAGNPVLLDLDNLKDDKLCMRSEAGKYETASGEQHFNYDNAMLAAKKQGKRMLTQKERDFICDLPRRWDDDRKGMWIIFDLVEGGTIDVFFEAAGYRGFGVGGLFGVWLFGYYWFASPSSSPSDFAPLLAFRNGKVNVSNDSDRTEGCSVRCVKDQNK